MPMVNFGLIKGMVPGEGDQIMVDSCTCIPFCNTQYDIIDFSIQAQI